MPYMSMLIRVFAQLAIVSFALAINSSSTILEQLFRNHPRDLPVKRSVDCGKWTMYCGGAPVVDGSGRGATAEGACNNACHYINKIDPLFVAHYRKDTDNAKNRIQAGCATQQGSVCNSMPFSQRFHDPFEQDFQTDPNDYEYNCDEFPMAAMTQADFGSDDRLPNSLRCIKKSQNSAMGVQLTNFIAGTGGGLAGRTCPDGPLPDDSTFGIVFNYDGADVKQLGFCEGLPDGSDAVPDPEYQFHMTSLHGGASGRISFPYEPNNDNRYAISTTRKDVLQCKVDVTRDTNNFYKVTVFDSNGNSQGTNNGILAKSQDALIVPGTGGLLPLAVIVEGPVGIGGTVGSGIDFNYGARTFTNFELGTDYLWTTISKGTDGRFSNQNPDITLPGGYCTVPNIIGILPGLQQIECYFPCNAS